MTKYLNAKNGIEILHSSGVTQILAGEPAPDEIGVEAHLGSIYMCSCTSGTIYKKTGLTDFDWVPDYSWSSPAEVIRNFIELTDTPTTYSGMNGRFARVNESGDGLDFDYIEFDLTAPDAPLIPDTAVSGTYFVNFEAGRLIPASIGAKPDMAFKGPICGMGFDSAKLEACYGSFKVPYAWNTETDITATINFMNNSTQVGETACSWRIDYQTYKDGESYSGKTSTTINIDYTLPVDASEGTYITHTLVIPNDDEDNPIERGDMMCFRFYRDGTDSSDTLVGDAILITLILEVKTGQNIGIGGI